MSVNSDADGTTGTSVATSRPTPAVDNPPGTTPAANDADKLNVTILNPDVVIVGVVVKGGPAANVYSTNVVNMIAPKNNGGNVPNISHWFVCYNFGAPPPPPNGNGGNGGGDGGGAGPGAGQPGQPGAARPVTAQAQFTG